jgi:hypothetical protein
LISSGLTSEQVWWMISWREFIKTSKLLTKLTTRKSLSPWLPVFIHGRKMSTFRIGRPGYQMVGQIRFSLKFIDIQLKRTQTLLIKSLVLSLPTIWKSFSQELWLSWITGL